MLDHHNWQSDAGTPPIPLPCGDQTYSQDKAEDFWFLANAAASFRALLASYPAIVSGGIVSVAAAWQVNITALIALVDFAVKVIDGTVVWAIPPSMRSDVATMLINMAAQASLDIHSGGNLSPVADGATTNYLYAAYAESTPSQGTRARTKKAGSYAFKQTPSFTLYCNSTNPGGDNTKVLLSTLKVSAAGAITLLSQAQPAPWAKDTQTPPLFNPNLALTPGRYSWSNASTTNFPSSGSCAAGDSYAMDVWVQGANITQLLFDATQGIGSPSWAWARSSVNGGTTWTAWMAAFAPAIGTEYIQGVNSAAPGTVWPGTTWADVSPEEAGRYRRIKGNYGPPNGGLMGVAIVGSTLDHAMPYHAHPMLEYSNNAGNTGTRPGLYTTTNAPSANYPIGAAIADGIHGIAPPCDYESRPATVGIAKYRRTA